jgi:hypothetical protein
MSTTKQPDEKIPQNDLENEPKTDRQRIQADRQRIQAVYDEQIAPLVDKIVDICGDHKIPFAASFQLGPDTFVITGDENVVINTARKLGR